MSNDLTPIRQMCEEFDVTARTLRFYEDQGLLSPERRGNARWYGAKDRTRLRLILRGKEFGLTIEEIRDLMDLYDPANGNVVQLRAVRATALRQLDLLERRKAELTGAIASLRQDLDAANRCLERKTALKAQ